MPYPASRVGLAIRRLQVRQLRALDAAIRPLGISFVQWDALRHPEASLRELAKLTYQSDQAFGTLAGRLVARGLIERVDGPGRAVRHRITDRGAEIRHAADDVVEHIFANSLTSLTPAQISCLDALLTEALPPPVSLPLEPGRHDAASA